MNFITVQDLLHFAKTQIGVKWYVGLGRTASRSMLMFDASRNMYSSEKTLHMCYATYQCVVLDISLWK